MRPSHYSNQAKQWSSREQKWQIRGQFQGFQIDSNKCSRAQTVDKNTEYKELPPPHSPFRLRNQKLQKLDKQFCKFVEVLKKLHFNILFIDALQQMPSYAKFMKKTLSKIVALKK